jgi:hypothetical protein
MIAIHLCLNHKWFVSAMIQGNGRKQPTKTFTALHEDLHDGQGICACNRHREIDNRPTLDLDRCAELMLEGSPGAKLRTLSICMSIARLVLKGDNIPRSLDQQIGSRGHQVPIR